MRKITTKSCNQIQGHIFFHQVEKFSGEDFQVETEDIKVCIKTIFEGLFEFSEQILFHFNDPRTQGKALSDVLKIYERETKHLPEISFLDPTAECFFFACDYGFIVNLSESLMIQDKLWKVKGIIGKHHKIFSTQGKYYQVKNEEVIIFEDSEIKEAFIVVLETPKTDKLIDDDVGEEIVTGYGDDQCVVSLEFKMMNFMIDYELIFLSTTGEM